MDTTLSRLTELFRHVCDDDTIVLTMDTNADDIEAWDSLMHVTLLANIEEEFDVRFSSEHVAVLSTVSELVQLIDGLHGDDAASAP